MHDVQVHSIRMDVQCPLFNMKPDKGHYASIPGPSLAESIFLCTSEAHGVPVGAIYGISRAIVISEEPRISRSSETSRFSASTSTISRRRLMILVLTFKYPASSTRLRKITISISSKVFFIQALKPRT